MPGCPVADLDDKFRYFYCPKASTREKNAGLKKSPVKANHHPTCKPLALCRYLCRLVTPPEGLIVDPFAGSASIGCEALSEGFRYWGAESDGEYYQIAEKRLESTQGLHSGIAKPIRACGGLL